MSLETIGLIYRLPEIIHQGVNIPIVSLSVSVEGQKVSFAEVSISQSEIIYSMPFEHTKSKSSISKTQNFCLNK